MVFCDMGINPTPWGYSAYEEVIEKLKARGIPSEQIAVAARDAGFEVIYQGIRLTPEQIAAAARDEDVDVIGLSILSGSHLELVPDVVQRVRAEGVEAPVIVGGIIPEDDQPKLEAAGVARVYAPKDYELARIMADIAELVGVSGG